MKKHYVRTIVAGLVLAANLNIHPALLAADPPATPETPARTAPADKPGEGRKLPFHGKLAAVDSEHKTITLAYTTGEKTFHLTPDTQILKHEQPATLAEAEIGNQVSGAYVRQGDRMEITKLNLVRKSGPQEDKPAKSRKEPRGAMKEKEKEKKS